MIHTPKYVWNQRPVPLTLCFIAPYLLGYKHRTPFVWWNSSGSPSNSSSWWLHVFCQATSQCPWLFFLSLLLSWETAVRLQAVFGLDEGSGCSCFDWLSRAKLFIHWPFCFGTLNLFCLPPHCPWEGTDPPCHRGLIPESEELLWPEDAFFSIGAWQTLRPGVSWVPQAGPMDVFPRNLQLG